MSATVYALQRVVGPLSRSCCDGLPVRSRAILDYLLRRQQVGHVTSQFQGNSLASRQARIRIPPVEDVPHGGFCTANPVGDLPVSEFLVAGKFYQIKHSIHPLRLPLITTPVRRLSSIFYKKIHCFPHIVELFSPTTRCYGYGFTYPIV